MATGGRRWVSCLRDVRQPDCFFFQTVKDPELRQKLKDEIKKQGKPYGLYFEDIQGGFTLTSATCPSLSRFCPSWCGGSIPMTVPTNWCAGLILWARPWRLCSAFCSPETRLLCSMACAEQSRGPCRSRRRHRPCSFLRLKCRSGLILWTVRLSCRRQALKRPIPLNPRALEAGNDAQMCALRRFLLGPFFCCS